MIKALTYVALCVTILAGSVLLYRNQPYSIRLEHEAEVKKEASVPAPTPTPTPTPAPFGPVPHVIVQSVPAPTPTPAEATPELIKKKAVKRKQSAANKLKSKWVAPKERPFSFGDLFNVR
jgi:hypothetical protein